MNGASVELVPGWDEIASAGIWVGGAIVVVLLCELVRRKVWRPRRTRGSLAATIALMLGILGACGIATALSVFVVTGGPVSFMGSRDLRHVWRFPEHDKTLYVFEVSSFPSSFQTVIKVRQGRSPVMHARLSSKHSVGGFEISGSIIRLQRDGRRRGTGALPVISADLFYDLATGRSWKGWRSPPGSVTDVQVPESTRFLHGVDAQIARMAPRYAELARWSQTRHLTEDSLQYAGADGLALVVGVSPSMKHAGCILPVGTGFAFAQVEAGKADRSMLAQEIREVVALQALVAKGSGRRHDRVSFDGIEFKVGPGTDLGASGPSGQTFLDMDVSCEGVRSGWLGQAQVFRGLRVAEGRRVLFYSSEHPDYAGPEHVSGSGHRQVYRGFQLEPDDLVRLGAKGNLASVTRTVVGENHQSFLVWEFDDDGKVVSGP